MFQASIQTFKTLGAFHFQGEAWKDRHGSILCNDLEESCHLEIV